MYEGRFSPVERKKVVPPVLHLEYYICVNSPSLRIDRHSKLGKVTFKTVVVCRQTMTTFLIFLRSFIFFIAYVTNFEKFSYPCTYYTKYSEITFSCSTDLGHRVGVSRMRH